jgi:hypothetical protein
MDRRRGPSPICYSDVTRPSSRASTYYSCGDCGLRVVGIESEMELADAL